MLIARRNAALLITSLGAVATASSASAATFAFKTAGGGDFNTPANYNVTGDAAEDGVPDADDTVVFGSAMGTMSPATITFAANGSAKNLSRQSGGPASLAFDLNGNTLTLVNQSDFLAGSTTFTDGTVSSTNQFVVGTNATLTLGSGALIKATGGANEVQVNSGGLLQVDGGRLQANTGERDISVASGGTIAFTGNGGSIRGRYSQFADGSSVNYTLVDDTLLTTDYYDAAPFSLSDVRNLGDLSFDLAPGFTGEVGDAFDLLTLTFPNTTTYSFDNVKFDNLADGAQVVKGNYTFEANYTSNLLSLEIVAIPEPASVALLIFGGVVMFGRRRHA